MSLFNFVLMLVVTSIVAAAAAVPIAFIIIEVFFEKAPQWGAFYTKEQFNKKGFLQGGAFYTKEQVSKKGFRQGYPFTIDGGKTTLTVLVVFDSYEEAKNEWQQGASKFPPRAILEKQDLPFEPNELPKIKWRTGRGN